MMKADCVMETFAHHDLGEEQRVVNKKSALPLLFLSKQERALGRVFCIV